MAYIVAKDYNKRGSYALRVPKSEYKNMMGILKDIKSATTKEKRRENVMIFPVTSMEAYMEYAPYKVVDTREDIKEYVASL